ncbi:hypothetical protein STSP2_00921 [Anaerohalosphaera lusitana]|uniref:Uncharacterized protein n=1 Tax=Anaerohalosphaera lusitana TaxID=1936003 RepID=A0A1U9NIL0_9BACT|nr:hypothetical protein [Anaerohalosphaera lusitana]AQT67772.1 hypothetical protein STSP2_00921 [Anaerohalosphaera lusitana]
MRKNTITISVTIAALASFLLMVPIVRQNLRNKKVQSFLSDLAAFNDSIEIHGYEVPPPSDEYSIKIKSGPELDIFRKDLSTVISSHVTKAGPRLFCECDAQHKIDFHSPTHAFELHVKHLPNFKFDQPLDPATIINGCDLVYINRKSSTEGTLKLDRQATAEIVKLIQKTAEEYEVTLK